MYVAFDSTSADLDKPTEAGGLDCLDPLIRVLRSTVGINAGEPHFHMSLCCSMHCFTSFKDTMRRMIVVDQHISDSLIVMVAKSFLCSRIWRPWLLVL